MRSVGTTRDGQSEGIRQGTSSEPDTQVFHVLREELDEDYGGLEPQLEVGQKTCSCGVVIAEKERAENVQAIFLTYIFVISLTPFFLGALVAYYLGGWKAAIGILVWLMGTYLMLVGTCIVLKGWIRKRRKYVDFS
jgi:hypothetical protein